MIPVEKGKLDFSTAWGRPSTVTKGHNLNFYGNLEALITHNQEERRSFVCLVPSLESKTLLAS